MTNKTLRQLLLVSFGISLGVFLMSAYGGTEPTSNPPTSLYVDTNCLDVPYEEFQACQKYKAYENEQTARLMIPVVSLVCIVVFGMTYYVYGIE